MKITERLKIMLKSILSLQMGEINTDKAVLIWDGEEDLKEGIEVFVRNEEDVVPAENGEYVTEDGKTIVVVDGKVAEIRDPEAEVAPESEGDQVESGITASEDEPEVEPADEPEVEPEAEPSIEERLADVEGRIAEIIDGINQIVNSIAALEGRITEVEGKLASVEAPAADPVDEEPISENETPKTKLSYMRRK